MTGSRAEDRFFGRFMLACAIALCTVWVAMAATAWATFV